MKVNHYHTTHSLFFFANLLFSLVLSLSKIYLVRNSNTNPLDEVLRTS